MVSQSLKEIIWRIANPVNSEHHTGYFDYSKAGDGVEQRIFVVLPFHDAIVEQIRDDVQDQLLREDFQLVYPGSMVHFASGDARWLERNDYTFGHVVKFAGLPAEPMPTSLSRVLEANHSFRGRQRRFHTRGELLLAERSDAGEPVPAGGVVYTNGNAATHETGGASSRLLTVKNLTA